MLTFSDGCPTTTGWPETDLPLHPTWLMPKAQSICGNVVDFREIFRSRVPAPPPPANEAPSLPDEISLPPRRGRRRGRAGRDHLGRGAEANLINPGILLVMTSGAVMRQFNCEDLLKPPTSADICNVEDALTRSRE